MNPIPPRKPLEKDEESALRRYMAQLGWLTEKTHGNVFMKGWPDLYAMHPRLILPGTKKPQAVSRWIELKREDNVLEPTQKQKFALWTSHGMGIWVLRGVDDYHLLFEPPNWMWWLDQKLKKLN